MAKLVEYIAQHLKNKGFNISVLDTQPPYKPPPAIYIRDKENCAQFQLIFWQGNYSHEVEIRLMGDPLIPSYNANLGVWLYIPSKHKLFTINLYNPSSISKLDKWLEENKSKLM